MLVERINTEVQITPAMPDAASQLNGAHLKRWLLLSLLVLLLDQATKWLILSTLQPFEPVILSPNLNLTLMFNEGAAFSFLSDAGGWQRWLFTGIGVVATVFIVWQLRAHPGQKLFCFALSSILGGAVGNVVDRLMHGYVVDFLDFHWAGYHFPAFNIADAGISVGAACLILDELLRVRNAR